MRSTKVQASGYAFLLRRLELALVMGDSRMAHDSLRTQRRALFMGSLLSLLVVGIIVVIALVKPEPDIEDSALVADESGALYVRLGEKLHPVTNVASARLLRGETVEIKKTTMKQIARYPRGEPVGIPDVPSLVPAQTEENQKQQWALCHPEKVRMSDNFQGIDHALLSSPSGVWMVVEGRRARIIADNSRGFYADTLEVSEKIVELLPEEPEIIFPQGESGLEVPFAEQGTLLRSAHRTFLVVEGGLMELRGERLRFAEGLATVVREDIPLSYILEQPEKKVLTFIPDRDVDWEAPSSEKEICVGDRLLSHPISEEDKTQDSAFSMGIMGTSAVSTEHGFFLISDQGRRYQIKTEEEMKALGFHEWSFVSWWIIASLADGGELSQDRARRIRPITVKSANTPTG